MKIEVHPVWLQAWKFGLISVFALALTQPVFAQEDAENEQTTQEGEPEETSDVGIVEDFRDIPLYASAGVNYGLFSGAAFPSNTRFAWRGEGGLLFQWSLFDRLPFWSGLEYQLKSYDLSTHKKTVNQLGKTIETSVSGTTRFGYVQLPFLVPIPMQNFKPRLHVLAGVGLAVRVYFHQEFTATTRIPADTITIVQNEKSTTNDALDYVDFNATIGARYRISNRVELWALASRKLFGLSISKENVVSAEEIHTNLALKLLVRIL